MDYKREAVEYLRSYDKLKIALDNLKCEILELKTDMKAIKAINYSGMPGGNLGEPDDAIVNKMYRLRKAEEEYKETFKVIKRMDQILKKFDETENFYSKILKGYFIECYTEEQLSKDLGMSDRNLRRVKQKALKIFAIQLFGIKVISG